MVRSLGLRAYLAWTRSANRSEGPTPEPCPKGPLIWCHAVNLTQINALTQIYDRLLMQRPDLSILLSTADDTPPNRLTRPGLIWQPLPGGSISDCQAFLDYWRPAMGIWSGGNLPVALFSELVERALPIGLVDADTTLFSGPVWRWFPDLRRKVLGLCDFIMAQDEQTLRFLRRIGAPDAVVSAIGPLMDGAVPLPYSRPEREELAQILRGRPIWLAAMLQPQEVQTVIDAHSQIARQSLRSLLVLVPADPDTGPQISKQLDDAGLRHVCWSTGELPGETTQVLLGDTAGDMGLWYRLAPIAFMGSSLIPGAPGCDPNEPAAHGSAILYGPNIRRYLDSYSRFAQTGAARIVRNAETLAGAVGQLIAPDQSAGMALAAWEVASRSAALTDRIADLMQDRLDQIEAR